MAYPKITDKDFYKDINKVYSKYKISNDKKTFKDICWPDKYELQVQQKFLPKFINPETPYKSMLLYHKIGAGKTCTAIRITEEWKGKRDIIVVVPASLIGNFRNELRSKCVIGNIYVTAEEEHKLIHLHPSSKEYKQIIKKSDDRIDKYYNILSYNKFIDQLQKDEIELRNCLLIIDEVQNMISEEGTYYSILKEAMENSDDKSRFIFMSATPMFDKPAELALTLNLLNPKYDLPTGRSFFKHYIDIVETSNGKYKYQAKNLDDIRQFCKGIVSHYRGAPPYTFPEKHIRIVKCKMSDLQYKAYKTVLQNENKIETKRYGDKIKILEENAIKDLPNNFFLGSRIISNVVYPNMKINERGLESFKGKYTTELLEKYSIKFYKILTRIRAAQGPVFVYSNFKEYGGIKSFQKVLEDNGFKNYLKHGEGRKRFAIWSGDESSIKREEIKAMFNRVENKDGNIIKVILGSPAIKEGVSLLRVKQVHIIEPTWNWSKMEQIIGRAVRFCSHKDLPKEEREVKVYIYVAISPNKEETTDEYILNLAIQKKNLISKFELALKESAVDCSLFKNANYYPNVDEEEIKCVL